MNFHFNAVSKPIELIRFEIGKNYTHKYIGDSNLFTTYKVVSRTKCFLKIQEQFCKKEQPILRVKIFKDRFCEYCYPVGKFSKCPVLLSEQKNES